MIRLETLVRDGAKLVLRSIYVNPAFVVSIKQDEIMTRDLRCEQMSKKFPQGLSSDHVLSEVIYSEANISKRILVIGSPEMVQMKMQESNTRTLLRG